MRRAGKCLTAALPLLAVFGCSGDDGDDDDILLQPGEIHRLETEQDYVLHTYVPNEYLKYEGTLTLQGGAVPVAAQRTISSEIVENAAVPRRELMKASDTLQVFAEIGGEQDPLYPSASYFIQTDSGSFQIFGAQVDAGEPHWYFDLATGEAPIILPSPMGQAAAVTLQIQELDSDNRPLGEHGYTYEVKEAEIVVTPAGTFEAFPVVTKRSDESAVTNWYYPPLGKVKTVQELTVDGAPALLEYLLVETNIGY